MSAPSLLRRKWRSYRRKERSVRLLAPPVFVMLGLARLAVVVLPFRVYVPLLGERVATADIVPPAADARDSARALTVRKSIAAVAAVTPWTSNCLPQALVACVLLRVYGVAHVTYLGTTRGDPDREPLRAHAWVMVSGLAVTGGRGAGRQTVVATFATPRSARRGQR
jgi:hypothetical protein